MCFSTTSLRHELQPELDPILPPKQNDHLPRFKKWFKRGAGTTAAAAGAGVGVPVAGTAALSAAGFTSAGIAAGSLAAGIQGPAVVAGSGFAIAQSIGATGGLAILGPVGLVAGLVGGGIAAGVFGGIAIHDHLAKKRAARLALIPVLRLHV